MSGHTTSSSSLSSNVVNELKHYLTQPVPPNSTITSQTQTNQNHHQNQNQNNPLKVAHDALEYLRDTGDNQFYFLRTILEITRNIPPPRVETIQQQQELYHLIDQEIELFFHCITGCRQVLLYQWNSYSLYFQGVIRDYFMILGNQLLCLSTTSSSPPTSSTTSFSNRTSNSSSSGRRTCAMACYVTSAAFWKRSFYQNNHHNTDQNHNQNQQTSTTTTTTTTNSINKFLPQEQLLIPEMERHCQISLPIFHSMSTSLQSNSNSISYATASLNDLLQYWNQLLSTTTTTTDNNHSYEYCCTTYLNCVIDEFNTTSTSTTTTTSSSNQGGGGNMKSAVQYRLPYEFHFKTHSIWEQQQKTTSNNNTTTMNPLLLYFQFALHLLQKKLTTSNQNSDHHQSPLLMIQSSHSIIKLVRTILNWDFHGTSTVWNDSSRSQDSSSTSSNRPSLKLPQEWGECTPLLQPDFIRSLFHYHHQNLLSISSSNSSSSPTNQNQNLQSLNHDLRQLFIQLASIQGTIYDTGTSSSSSTTTIRREAYIHVLCEGTVQLLQHSSSYLSILINQPNVADDATVFIFDTIQLSSRMISNFRLKQLMTMLTLSQSSQSSSSNVSLSISSGTNMFLSVLHGLTNIGTQLLHDQIVDCRNQLGDYDSMEYYEFRENALSLLLDCCVLCCDDPWLLSTSSTNGSVDTTTSSSSVAAAARLSLANILGPLYERFVSCRIQLTSYHEQYIVANNDTGNQYNEIHEQIEENDLQEEMESIATIGRLSISNSISCLSTFFGSRIPQLYQLWDTYQDPNHPTTTMTPIAAALLEEIRILTMYVSYLLTDGNEGECPTIPNAVYNACQENESLTHEISSAVQALITLADQLGQRLNTNANNMTLSPLLGQTLLWFLHRWASAYMYPLDYCSSPSFRMNRMVQVWSNPEQANQVITFCLLLCLRYQCYWPQESIIQDHVAKLLYGLATRTNDCPIRNMMLASPYFVQLVQYHCSTYGLPYSISHEEFAQVITKKLNNGGSPTIDMPMIYGYHRLPYHDKARNVTSILIICNDHTNKKNEMAVNMFNESLFVVQDGLHNLMTVLTITNATNQKQNHQNQIQHGRETACLCVEMFHGIVRAGAAGTSSGSSSSNDDGGYGTDEPDRIISYITRYLPTLSNLMHYYASDLSVCEVLLSFFRTYTEYYIALLDPEQSYVLFHCVADVLKQYGTNHYVNRSIPQNNNNNNNYSTNLENEIEEEQSYNDILCAVQLLINLGTKDFIDACTTTTSTTEVGTSTNQVTDMIFYGLQQLIPLMTQGLLQYPKLCQQFFNLLGFMTDTYPDKVCMLPYELFHPLFEALLFGISHENVEVGRQSLQGLASIIREHLQSQALNQHLVHHPYLLDECCRKVLCDVLFHSTIITDRIEATGMALFPFIAMDANRFVMNMQELVTTVVLGSNNGDQHTIQDRIHSNVTRYLMQPDVLSKVLSTGYEGRTNRIKFKKDFELFVTDLHTYLVLK